MNKILKLSLISTCLLGVTSCGGDGLGKYRRNKQLIELTYQDFDKKMIDNDSFVFYLSADGCPACKEMYPEIKEFLKENKDTTLYYINKSEMQEVDKIVLQAYYIDALGNNYFSKKGLSRTALYTPSIAKVVKGEFTYAQIANIDQETLTYMYQDNYMSYDSYYMYNRKVQKKETFNIFISKNGDEQYDASLREYFIINPSLNGYFLNVEDFDESEKGRLLNRINYCLGEENAIEDISDYCLLQYEEGSLVNYTNVKYDSSSLDALYK